MLEWMNYSRCDLLKCSVIAVSVSGGFKRHEAPATINHGRNKYTHKSWLAVSKDLVILKASHIAVPNFVYCNIFAIHFEICNTVSHVFATFSKVSCT